MQNKKAKTFIIASALVLAVIALVMAAINSPKPQEAAASPLTQYWTKDSAAAQSLRDYVTKVTDPKDEANFIPVEDRIAVFDMDGTLVCETYYTYYGSYYC